MLEDVKKRLLSFGYEVVDADNWGLDFIIQKVENYIKNNCNVESVPLGLNQIAVDMAVGEFLLSKKSTGQMIGIDMETAIKQIQEGDTTVTFAIGDGDSTPEKRLDSLISHLMNYGKGSLASYRCIRW